MRVGFAQLHRIPGSPMNTEGPGKFLCGHNIPSDKNIGSECHNFSLKNVHLEPVQGGWGCFFLNGTRTANVSPGGLSECFAQCATNGSLACPV